MGLRKKWRPEGAGIIVGGKPAAAGAASGGTHKNTERPGGGRQTATTAEIGKQRYTLKRGLALVKATDEN